MTVKYSEIMTFTGELFNFADPQPDQVDIRDIAHALSLTCRFSGHCPVFYSVAEHSIRVAHISLPEDKLSGLLHDAAEAYITDIPGPAKALLPDYQALEIKVFRAIARKFAISEAHPASVKKADGILLATEAREFYPLQWHLWELKYPPLEGHIIPMSPKEAEEAFLSLYYQLCEERSPHAFRD